MTPDPGFRVREYAVARGVAYDALAPHRALRDTDADRADDPPDLLAYLRGADPGAAPDPDRLRALQAFLRAGGSACRQTGVLPLTVVQYDLAAMEAKPYLASYFAARSEER